MINKCCRTCKWNRGICLAPNSEYCSRSVIDDNLCSEYACKYEKWIQELGKEPAEVK